MKKWLLALTLMGLAACSSAPKAAGSGAIGPDAPISLIRTPVLDPNANAREDVAFAIELLGQGRTEEGRAAINVALAKSPSDRTALFLLKQIESDPVALLGEASQPYVVAAGDTISTLADRFLGNPLLFVALSRYNGLAAPNRLEVGRILRVPTRIEAPDAALVAGAPAPDATKASRANAVRLEALEQLNAGDVVRAVDLLTEAQSLDQTNAAIQKDLERARRIQSALGKG